MLSSINTLNTKQMTDIIQAQKKAFRMNPSPVGNSHPDINLSNQGVRGIIDSEGQMRCISDLLLDENFKLNILYLNIKRDFRDLEFKKPSGWRGLNPNGTPSAVENPSLWRGEFINLWIDCFPIEYWTLLEKILLTKNTPTKYNNIKGVVTRLQNLFLGVKVTTGPTQWEQLHIKAVQIIEDCKVQHNDVYDGIVHWDTLWRYLVIHMFPRTSNQMTGKQEFKTQPFVTAAIIGNYIVAGLETEPEDSEEFFLNFIHVQEDITNFLALGDELEIEEQYALNSQKKNPSHRNDSIGEGGGGRHNGNDTSGRGRHQGNDTGDRGRKRSRGDHCQTNPNNSEGGHYGPGSNPPSRICDGCGNDSRIQKNKTKQRLKC